MQKCSGVLTAKLHDLTCIVCKARALELIVPKIALDTPKRDRADMAPTLLSVLQVCFELQNLSIQWCM